MGRTIPSFRIALAMEKKEWKSFRIALDKKEKKDFDDMFDTPKLYISAGFNSVQLVPLHPIIISILFRHYQELKECVSEVEQIQESRVSDDNYNSSKDKELTIKEEE
jgi:hypothetical protein